MAKLFFSYSHDDEPYRDELEKHLALLKRQNLIESWHDRRITAGSELVDRIDEQIEAADIILLLVSASFIASEYCYSREMKRAIERHEKKQARVIPVIVRPCDWHSAPFGKLLAVPKDGKPISTWPNPDDAYTDIARSIRRTLEETGASENRDSPAALPTTSISESPPPRSSNLRLKKEFSQLELDTFLRDTFEYSGRFFESSLEELKRRNSEIDFDFRRIDANTFTSAIYRSGRKESECSIHLGSGFSRHPNILFSTDASARGNSYNEALSVEQDDQRMYIKPLASARHDEESKLSPEGCAELLWSLLIDPLQ